MAPKRGSSGGTSSGGSSVSDDGSSGSDSGSSEWLAMSQVYGLGFTDGYEVADIVFVGIWLVALCGIAVWAMGARRQSQVGRPVLGWQRYGLAMCLTLT